MPLHSILVSAAVVAMLVAFAGAFVWAEFQMRSGPRTQSAQSKRRSF